jgi:hypothetical protein
MVAAAAAAVAVVRILLTTTVSFPITRETNRIKMSTLDGQIFKIRTGTIKNSARLDEPFINKAMTYSNVRTLYQHSQSILKKLQMQREHKQFISAYHSCQY